MSTDHARLGPSAAERWLACPASVRMSAEVPDNGSSYAREGTLAHTRAEIEAAVTLGHITPKEARSRVLAWRKEAEKELTEEQIAEIIPHAEAWAELLVQRRDAMGPGTVVFLEVRLFPDVPESWGTGDAVLVSPSEVEVIDFKYGSGKRVYVNDNPQLMEYGLGALEGFGDTVDTTEVVRITVYQPRMDEEPFSQEWDPDDLRTWRRDVLLPGAELALTDDAPFNPGEVQCRWCPAAGICRPRMEAATAEDFSQDPDILTDDELAEIMERIPAIREWANAVEKLVFKKVHDDGHDVGGWKIVKTEGKRSIVDHPQAISRLIDAGYDSEAVSRRTAKTLGDLEKLVGKTKLPEILGETLKKGEGSKALAPADDPRPAWDPTVSARADFSEEPS